MTRIKRLVPKRRFKKFKNVDEWAQYDFKQLYEVSSGYAFNYQDYCDHGISLINGASIEHGKINKSNMNYLPEDFLSQYSNFVVKENDIVLGLNRPIINGNLKISKIPIELNNSLLYQRAGKINYMTEMDNDFSFVLLSQEILKYTLREAVGSDQPFISTSKLSNWKIIIPKGKKEQEKIGSFFKNIDEMIQLQQSKVNKVKDLKSAYLSEMFPKEGEKYPKKRFEGFSEPWQLFKLGELGQFRSNGVNKKIRANDNPAYLLNYMDVYNKLSINQMNYKDLMKVTATSRELQENNIMKNDVFFTPTSETADDIGRVLTLEYDLPETVYSYHLIRFRPFEDKLYSIFPNYGFATKYLRKQMEIAAQGVQRFVISVTAFKDLKVYLPSYEEQIKIANFFKNLDNQISIEEEKLAKLEKLKQAYLNDMFV